MRELPLRLNPGADLKGALEAHCRIDFPDGAFVVCGIGSIVDPRLRLAAQDNETVFPGPYELLALCGTVTKDGAHLHASFASSTGEVVGGHVVYGSIVRTTAEVLLVEPTGWSMRRAPDARTGFRELELSRTGTAEGAA